MKTIIFSFLLLAISGDYLKGANADPLVNCPTKVSDGCPLPQGKFPVFFAHPDHCSMFCECGVEGIAWEISCQEGLVWNEKLNTCDWPTNVDCGARGNP